MGKMIYELLLVCSPAIFAGIFHMVVVKYNWFCFLSYPLDHKKTFRGKRIFGDNKTYRGLVAMVLLAAAFSWYYQYFLMSYKSVFEHNLLWLDSAFAWFQYGVLFGVGYVVGELPNSFYKRQKDIQPGKSNGFWTKIIDQFDSVVSVLVLLLLFSDFTWNHFWFGLVFFGLFHAAVNVLLYIIGLRKEPF